MFDVLPATRPESRFAALPLLYAVMAHAGIVAVAMLPGVVLVSPIPPPAITVRFVAAAAAPLPQQEIDGSVDGEERAARLYFAPASPSEPTAARLDSASQPVALAPAPAETGAPDEGSSGVRTALIDARKAPRRRAGAVVGASVGPSESDGDLLGLDGGAGHAISTDGALPVGGAVSAPEIIEQIRPEYPAMALVERTEGVVVLTAIIDDQGGVEDVRAVTGPPSLRDSAIHALKLWKFRPGTLNGKPVKVSFTLTVRFALRPMETIPYGSESGSGSAAPEATDARL